tara:strand:- start:2824 stop:3012 length:189 start_codon:yes stop_codon:yes gene_type:complete
MNQYRIKYTRMDMPDDYVGSTVKWARNENEAVKIILKKIPDMKRGCVFKRGGIGKIVSVEQI